MSLIPTLVSFFAAKADEALKAKERSEEEAKRRKEEGEEFSFISLQTNTQGVRNDYF